MATSNVDTIHRLACFVETPLVEDGVDGYRCLPCLPVSDDELALTPTDGNHRIDGLDACLQRLSHRLTVDDTRGLALQRHVVQRPLNGALAVNRRTDGVDDASHEVLSYLDRCDATGAPHGVAFVYGVGVGQHDNADVVFFEILDNALLSCLKFYQLSRLGVVESVSPRDAIADGQHGAHLFQRDIQIHFGQLLFKYCRYLGRLNF